MAQNPLQIHRETPAHKSMDFFFLKEEGIRLVQELSGKFWTDYNTHDPGVTILEQLCYALADLGFRTDFQIQELLNVRLPKGSTPHSNTFFDASEILPTNPVSLVDYRKLIIDHIPEVKNAWIEPVMDNLQGIKGLYRVMLQLDETQILFQSDDNAKGVDAHKKLDSLREKVKAQVFALFNAHRNLCEDIDIDQIEILKYDTITIFADLDISSDIVAEEALAEILFKLEEHLNPSIQYYTIEELLEEGYEIDDILDGPVPKYGIIKTEDLRPMRQEVYISKIIEIISSIEGVRRINFFRVEKDGFPVEGDVIRIEDKTYPILDMDPLHSRWDKEAYPIRFQRGNLPYNLDLNTTNQLFYSLYAKYKKGYQVKMLYNKHDYPSLLKHGDLSRYFSIQHTFPGTYGLGIYGLPNNVRATREREVMIKQLKGYLVFFEQLMANYLAQLSNVRNLFSLDENLDKTYFSQIPKDIHHLFEILPSNTNDPNDFSKAEQQLEGIMKEFDPYLDRRNRVLDHLLARFGEQFTTDFLLKVSQYVGYNMGEGEGKAPEQELIEAKIGFLKNYVDISRNRSKGFNYLGLFHVIHQQELAWADVFDQLLLEHELEEEKDIIRQQFAQLRENYPARVHQRDFFSMALNFKSPEQISLIQNNSLLEEIDLPEKYLEAIKDVNLSFAKKAKDVLDNEVAGLEKRVCLLLHIIQSGNESLLRAFENTADIEDLEEMADIIEFASPALPEGRLDLEEELKRLKALQKDGELSDEEDEQLSQLEDLDEDLDEIDIPKLDDLNLGDDFDDAEEENKADENDAEDQEEEESETIEETLDYKPRFIFRAHSQDELMDDLLSNGIMAHNYIVLPQEKDGASIFAIYYRGNKHLGCIKVRECTTRLAARMEIQRIVKYLNLINRHTEGMHVVEHILLRPQAQDRHGFQLINDQERVLLQSYELSSRNEQKALSNELHLLAKKEENFEIEQISENKFALYLKQGDQIIASYPEELFSLEGAKEQITYIIDFVQSFRSSTVSLQDSNVRFFLEERNDAEVDNGFYSLGMTVVLPSWPSRFQNEDFRTLIKNVFCVNVPAHIKIDFYWLETSAMKDFETVYFDWLEERNSLTPEQPLLDNKALEVVQAIQKISAIRNL